jgi:hypothetical protein
MGNREKPPLMVRVEQLIQEFRGREWKKICERLSEEGYGELGTNLLRKKYTRWESKTEPRQQEQRIQPQQLLQEPETEQHQGVAAMTELIAERIFNHPIPEQWISQIEDHVEDMMKPVMLRVAEEAAAEVLQSISFSHGESVGALEEPPEPERVPGTRRENRDWERISATIDRNLIKFFNREKKKRRISTSRLLETILWLHYGKPRLSYDEGYRTEAFRQKDISESISEDV